MDLSDSNLIIGDLRSMQIQSPEKENDRDYLHLLFLMEAVEHFISFGVPSGCEYLRDEDVFEDICKDFHGVTEVSKRLKKLDSYIKKIKEDSRMLAFSNKQITPRYFTSYTQQHFPCLNAKMVVGHSGYYGMACEDEQENYIKEFAKGDTQLIVTTSVLEEGIDVGQCDTVVAFTELKSLIGFIQIRGGTRK